MLFLRSDEIIYSSPERLQISLSLFFVVSSVLCSLFNLLEFHKSFLQRLACTEKGKPGWSVMASFVRIMALTWADVLAVYALWVMMTYLTDVWKLDLTPAATILNIFWGATMIMPIAMAFIADTFMGDFSLLLLSSLAYCVGLGILTMSTPPVMGKCSDYSPDCITDKQKVFFYTGLALIAVGMSGHIVSLPRFLAAQFEEGDADEGMGDKALGICGVVLVAVVGGIALPYVKPWSLRFGIPAICSLAATLLFLSGSCSYTHSAPSGSPITTLVRVFVASTSKLFHRSPSNSNQLYENTRLDYHVPYTKGLRCLDKAAIILAKKSLEEQENNRWRLCSVTEVEETKTIIRMIPMWLTFIMCGVVSSIGNTYFLEQANNMNPKVGKLKVPLTILLMFYDGAKSNFAVCLSAGPRKYVSIIGIAVAMVFSVLCCITAAKVEGRRLNVIMEHELLDKPDERIPMTLFWLVPQFMLLGALDGIFQVSVTSFFASQAPESMRNYLYFFTFGIIGLGTMGSVVTVYVVGKISERGGGLNWFQDTLSRSRLDKYYWTLAAMSAVNLVLYIVVAMLYNCRDSGEEEDEEKEGEEQSVEPFDDNVECCCC